MSRTFVQPDSTSQSTSVWIGNVDDADFVMARIAASFAPHEQSTPDMTVRVDAGAIFDGSTLTEKAAQNTGTITAPSSNPRNDIVYVDRGTGTVGVATGTEAPSPTDPAIPAGKAPVARIRLQTSTTSITNSLIDDIRVLSSLGLGTAAFEDVGTGANNVVQLDGSGKLPAVDGSQLTGITTVEEISRTNILLNAFRIAVNGSLSVPKMVDGMVDAFVDETGVDTAGSSNETYDSAGDFYHNSGVSQIGQGVGTAIGDMNSTSDAGGLAASFDGQTSEDVVNSSRTGSDTSNGWVGKDWGAGNTKTITKAVVYAPDSGTYPGFHEGDRRTANVTLTLQGSTDNFSSSIVDLGNTGSFVDTSGLVKTITATDTSTAYRYHRVRLTSDQSGAKPVYAELEFTEDVGPSNMTLISNAFTAEAQPDDAFIVLFEEDMDTVTINTDLKVYASRNGGTTFTQATLSNKGDYETGKRVLTGTADISGQSSGTSMKWKIETLNNKEQRIHGVALEWRS